MIPADPELPEGRPLSVAESDYLEYLTGLGSGQPADFERFCAERPAIAEALRRVHARWSASAVASAPISLRFSERLLARYGPESDPGVTIVDEPSSAAPDTEVSPSHGDRSRYRVVGEVARGGMGAIFEVWDRDLERPLAMKVIQRDGVLPTEVPAQLLRRFLREAKITGQLDHPGVVPVHDVGIDDEGRVYFTMRLVAGRDLRRVFELSRDHAGGWNRSRALGVLLKVADTMAYCHEKGVIHRDLKPANVMVGNFGEVYVMDWGLAKLLRGDTTGTTAGDAPPAESIDAGASLTGAGALLGTPVFMAPEQVDGRHDQIGPRTDVYAVGSMLYTLLTGELPYGSSESLPSAKSVLEAVRAGPPPPVVALDPRAPAPLVEICERAMARVPTQRYASMLELGEALRSFLEAEEQAVLDAERVRAEAENAKQVAAFLTGIFEVSDPNSHRGHEVTAHEILDRGAARLETDLSDQPLVRATLKHTMGAIYENLGLYESSEPLLADALETRRAELGPDSLEVAETLTALGTLRARQGNGPAATELFSEALEIRRRQRGSEDTMVATSLSDLAAALLLNGEIGAAEPLCREALELRRRLGEEDTVAMGHALHNLAIVLAGKQAYAEAEPLYRQALTVWRLREHLELEMLSLLNNLGDCLFLMGRYAESAEQHREALGIKERLLGSEHPTVATTLNNLGSTLYAWGDLDEAERLLARALDLRRRLLGKGHPSVGTTLSNLGNVRLSQQRLEEAEALHRESVVLREARLGAQHPQFARGLSGLAHVLEAREAHEEAERLHRRALDIRRQAFGDDHPEIAVNELGLARLALVRGDEEAAERLARRALATVERELPATHPKIADARHVLASILGAVGRQEEARALVQLALEWRRAHLLPGHGFTAESEVLARRLGGAAPA